MKLIRPALSFLSVGLLAILTACGGGGGGSSTPVVTISGASGTIAPNGTFNLTASVTGDSTNSGVSWTISPASGSGTLSNESTTAATYTAPSSVPASPSVTITATSIANSQGSNSVTFLIQQPTVQVPQYLNGQYAFVMSGFDSSGNPLTVGGSITANGGGSITDGVIDVNDNLNNTTTSTPVTGTYTLDSNLRGTIKITNALQGFSATPTFSFTLDSTTNTGNIISLDPSLPAISGTIDKQQAAAFNAIPSGSFIFRAYSDNPVRASMVGRVNVLGGGSISNGFYDLADILNGNDATDQTVSGTFATSDSHGRGTLLLQLTGQTGTSYVYYAVSPSKVYIFENGTSGITNTQMVGQLRTQNLSSLTSSSPNGSGIFGLIGGDYYTSSTGVYLLGSVTAGNLVISGGNATANFDLNDASYVSSSTGGSPASGSVTFDPTTGRGTLTFNGGFDDGFIDAAVFYLEATGKGVILDTTVSNGDSYPEAFVGDLTPQTAVSAVSGTVQGVDLISESDIPVVATAGAVTSGSISALQDGSLAASGIASGQALAGIFGAVSSSGRSIVTLNSQFLPLASYPSIAYAIDATHFYVIGVYGTTSSVYGYSSSLGVYSTQTLPPAADGVNVQAKPSTGRSFAVRRKLPTAASSRRGHVQLR